MHKLLNKLIFLDHLELVGCGRSTVFINAIILLCKMFNLNLVLALIRFNELCALAKSTAMRVLRGTSVTVKET